MFLFCHFVCSAEAFPAGISPKKQKNKKKNHAHTQTHTHLLELWVDIVQVPLEGFAVELLAELHSASDTGDTFTNRHTSRRTDKQSSSQDIFILLQEKLKSLND